MALLLGLLASEVAVGALAVAFSQEETVREEGTGKPLVLYECDYCGDPVYRRKGRSQRHYCTFACQGAARSRGDLYTPGGPRAAVNGRRRCACCRALLPVEQFHKTSFRKKDGTKASTESSYCKECRVELVRVWRSR